MSEIVLFTDRFLINFDISFKIHNIDGICFWMDCGDIDVVFMNLYPGCFYDERELI